MKNNLIILGGTGRLGKVLVEYFSKIENIQVISIDKKTQERGTNSIHLSFDIENTDLIDELIKLKLKKSLIINASGVQHSFFAKNIYKSNYLAPVSFINGINNIDLSYYFVQISSISVSTGEDIIPVPGEGTPINYYGYTKRKFEFFLKENLQHKNFFILRPGAFYGGDYENKNFEKFLTFLKKGLFIYPKRKVYRSYTNVNTVVSAIEIIANDYFSGIENLPNISNLTDVTSLSTFELFKKFKKELNHKNIPIIIPTFIFKFVAKFSYFLEKYFRIHINLLTMIGEQGFNFTGKVNSYFINKKLEQYETKFE